MLYPVELRMQLILYSIYHSETPWGCLPAMLYLLAGATDALNLILFLSIFFSTCAKQHEVRFFDFAYNVLVTRIIQLLHLVLTTVTK